MIPVSCTDCDLGSVFGYGYGICHGGHEQLISHGEMFKPAFTKRDRKQTRIDLRGISTKTSYVPPQGFLGSGCRMQSQIRGRNLLIL
jgi:hypothetical protein